MADKGKQPGKQTIIRAVPDDSSLWKFGYTAPSAPVVRQVNAPKTSTNQDSSSKKKE
jgi:hypothetical protein